MQFSARQAANVGLLTAVSIVLTRIFGLGIPLLGGFVGLRITLGEVPLILAGILFGPWAGLVAGFASDLIGYLINPFGGPFFSRFCSERRSNRIFARFASARPAQGAQPVAGRCSGFDNGFNSRCVLEYPLADNLVWGRLFHPSAHSVDLQGCDPTRLYSFSFPAE